MINWNNMDTLQAYKVLQKAKKTNLKKVMNGNNGANRVKSYSVQIGAGLEFNYGARPVDDEIINILAGLSSVDELLDTSLLVSLDTSEDASLDVGLTKLTFDD